MRINNLRNLRIINNRIQTGNGIIDALSISNCALIFSDSLDSFHTDILTNILIPLPKIDTDNFLFYFAIQAVS